MSKLSELRDRRVVQIVLAYGAAGYVVLELFDQLADRGIVPEFVYALVLAWYVGGFFASAVIGWFHGEKGAQKAPPLEIVLLSAFVIGMGALSVSQVGDYLAQRETMVIAGESQMDLRRVAVRYFEDFSRDAEYGYLADGLTEDLIVELAKVRTLDVLSPNAVAPFREGDVSADSVARALDAGTVVEGSVEPEGEQELRINVRLIDGESGAPIQRTSIERSADDLLALREEVAEQVARFLREWLGEEVEIQQRARATDDDRAWAFVLRAERARKEMKEAFDAGDRAAMEDAWERADRLLEQAETLDSEWAEPAMLRGQMAYDRSRMAQDRPEELRWIDTGMDHIQGPLDREPNHAEALKVRGALRFARWRRDPRLSDDERERLLGSARTDLERAVDLDPSLASGHYLLAYLYGLADQNPVTSALAARDAYQEDAYLENADQILYGLFTTSWDLRQLGQAQRWCAEAQRRFPDDSRFVMCELQLMTTPALEADPDRAWGLVARLDSIASDRIVLHGRIMAAGVLGRASLEDSARSVLLATRERADYANDPEQETAFLEAEIRSRVLGDYDEAIDLLKRAQAATEGHGFDPGGDLSWRWDELRNHPRFDELTVRH